MERNSRQDHPRIGGEKAAAAVSTRFAAGSPPHGRGKGEEKQAGDKWEGITPAWAGKSLLRETGHGEGRDHPRMGGEKPPYSFSTATAIGSPPAWAGKRALCSRDREKGRDHPRMGGEKLIQQSNGQTSMGSPPHGRGKAHELRTLPRAVRITPAWAGKSRKRCRTFPRGRDHPRMGGEKRASQGQS